MNKAGRLQPLPGWSRYLVRLGRYIVEHDLPGRHIVVGISLPTRSFAAAMVAVGVVEAAYEDPEKRDPRTNFDRIAALPKDTWIRFRRGKYLYLATLIGVENKDGVEHLVYYEGSTKCSLPWRSCSAVDTLDPDQEFVRRRLLAPNAHFVEAALNLDPYVHASYTRLDCLIVGVKETLRKDVLEQRFFACPEGLSPVPGVLNDVLRCDAFELNRNDHDLTTVISGSEENIPDRLKAARPPTVIFDGPGGYLRLRDQWRKSPWIVLLDRTSPSAYPAGETFTQELALSVGDVDLSPIGSPPPAFEVSAYYEATR